MRKKGGLISEVEKDSIADELGIEAGDRVLRINGTAVRDILDYKFLTADECIELEIEKKDGEVWLFDIEKDCDEDLGLVFREALFDRVRPCINNCLFCFVDQLPPGMRPSLYIKDDDYRLSFLFGNFVTLTNMGKSDWERVLKMRLSPLYVSVHTTNPELRVKMLGNPRASSILADLSRLKEHNIEIHTQIVLCPGLNDGKELEQTIDTLATFWPSVRSVGVVPVGLTGYRKGLPRIRPVDMELARKLIDLGQTWQERFRKSLGTGFVYMADEFYIKAMQPFPPLAYYDDFSQLENGVGMARLFLEEFRDAASHYHEKDLEAEAFDTYIVCGFSAVPVMQEVSRWCRSKGINFKIMPVKSWTFGGQVTVTGLVTGHDIIRALGKDFKGKKVLVPAVMLKDGEGLFLDDTSLDELRRATGAVLDVVEMEPSALLSAIMSHNYPY